MPRYLISFNDGDMTFPPDELPAVSEASHAVVHAAKEAGVWIFGAGLLDPADASTVAADGTASAGPAAGRREFLGGFSILETASREDALAWAARIAEACRCAQEVRELMDDPES
jgi:hypothetical protein